MAKVTELVAALAASGQPTGRFTFEGSYREAQ